MKFKLIILICLTTKILGLPDKSKKLNRLSRLKRDDKIIGGTDASPGEFPYQISLQDGSFGFDEHICGGSIYNENYIITAAHCVYDEDTTDPSYLTVYAGIITIYETQVTEQARSVSEITIHPDFNSYTFSSDIALLKLAEPLDLSGPNVSSIDLPEVELQSEGICSLTGWGETEPNQGISTTLQQVEMAIVSDEDCREQYGDPDVEDSMLCAGSEGEGGCNGDAGGPLVCENTEGLSYLAGIASWAYGCALANYPGVFAETSYFVEWIEENAT